jgi:hypothetical protein
MGFVFLELIDGIIIIYLFWCLLCVFIYFLVFDNLIFYLPFGAEDLPDLDFDPATAQLSNILYSKCL